MQKLKSLVHSVLVNDHVRRLLHTAWQAAGGILISQLLVAHSSADVKKAVIVAGAAALSAVKALLVARA